MRTLSFFLTLLVVCIGQQLATAQNTTADAQKPGRSLNVLFIAVDDLNTRLNLYGHSDIKTPNIDRLAARGVTFDRAYCQYPLCNPSRTSLLSGRRPDTTGVLDNTVPPRTKLGDVVFLPEYFARHGYFTARVGKIAHGTFEDAVDWGSSQGAKAAKAKKAGQAKAKGKSKAEKQAARQPGQVGRLVWRATENADADEPDGRTARRIAELLEQSKDRPFFIAAGFHKPHLPFVAPRKYFDLYPAEQIKLPPQQADDLKDIPPAALTHRPVETAMTEREQQEAVAAYQAATSFMDAQVGVLLDTLDRLKLWDTTVVVFFGDHGWHLGEHGGLYRKMTVFEPSARVPLIVSAPGRKAGARSERLVELVDLYPTLVALCGLPTPEGLEGTSLGPLLDNPDREWKKAAFTQVEHGRVMGRSIRTERYRYTEWDDGQHGAELYDHEKDPHEFTNLAEVPEHSATVAELRQVLHKVAH